MNLRGRQLSVQLQGDDVKLLQNELHQLRLVIDDPVGFFGTATRAAVLEFQRTRGIPPTGIVDEDTARRINEEVDALATGGRFVVRGHVRSKNQEPLAEIEVRAFDKDLRHEQQLGISPVDKAGIYEITYTTEQFRRSEKETADLIVRAFDANQKQLAESDVRFNAAPIETIDLSIGDGQDVGSSEYQQLVEALTPVLEGVPLAELTDKDVTFLVGETEQDARRIGYLVTASQLANQTGLPAEAFYGFARQDLPTELAALLAQHPSVQRLALQTAIQGNIIPARLKPLVDDILTRMQQLRVQQALRSSGDIRSPSLGDLLSTCLPEDRLQQAFASLYLRHEGSLDDFWKVLRGSPDFQDDAAVQGVQLAFGLADFTQNHLSMVQVLQRSRSGDARSSLRALAKRDVQDWIGLIGQVIGQDPNAFPPEVEGANAAEKAANYAEEIVAAVASAFPTAVIAHKLENDELPHWEDLLQFFAANPDFELASMPVQRYLNKNPQTALAGISDREGVTQQLQSMERVFKLTPDYAEMRVLLQDGVDSAHRIVGIGKENFVADYGDRLNGEDAALDIYYRALTAAGTAVALHAKFAAEMDPLRVAAIPPPPTAVDVGGDFPEWKTLFGALESCACEHCRSVLSPAAYLVDVLRFLHRCRKGPTGKTPLQMLLARRADIQDIKLSCQNTNTPLPYIDLVNEVLENAVLPFGGAGVWQTRATAEELSAYPEADHSNPKVYQLLANDVYPWDLPFDLPLEQVRLYLDHAGVRLYEVMENYLGRTVPSAPDLADAIDTAIAAEYLGLSPKEWQIVVRRDLKTTARFWDFAPNPAAPAGWIDQLRRVSTFLDRSGLSYAALLELLDTDFIDPAHTLRISPNGECDPDKLTIVGLSLTALEKIHRFVRLARKLGWSFRDLDRSIAAFKPVIPGDLNLIEVLLVQLSHVARLHAELDVPIAEVLTWWSEIDRRSYDTPGIPQSLSLYERLFRNRALLSPIDAAFGPDGTGFPISSVAAHLPALQAALGIRADDLKLLSDPVTSKEMLQLSKAEVPAVDLTFADVSHLYRVASLAKALQLPLLDFLSLKALTHVNPAADPLLDPVLDLPLDAFHDTASTQRFVATARAIAASPFSIEQLDYLLRGAVRPSSSIAPKDGELRALFADLQLALDKIAIDTTPAPDPKHELMKRMLAQVIPAARIESAIEVIADENPLGAETLKDRADFITLNFKSFLNPDEAKAKLLITNPPVAGSLRKPEDRFAYVLPPLLAHVRQVLSEQEAISRIAGALNLQAETAKSLLLDLVKPPFPAASRAIDVFLLETFDFNKRARMYRMMHKIALLVDGFEISVDELTWLFAHGPARGWLDFNRLPILVADKPPAGASLFAWKRLATVYALFRWKPSLRKDSSAGADAHRVPFFNALIDKADKPGASASDLRLLLASLMGWRFTDEVAAALSDVLALTLVKSYTSERGMLALKAALDMSERLTLPPKQLRNLCNVSGLADQVDELMQSVRSGFDKGRPISAIKPVCDALREKQRSALVSHLVVKNKFRTPEDLFAELLIDVEMSSCQLTSRIKQAMSSAQLFVQRALMGLEKSVSISRANAKTWEWMQNYRVWEANRKVFLWPENWIEPQLRDDKTEFFKDLENELLQDEITPENVESAFLTYLTRLDDIARPEVCAFYHQQESALPGEDVVDILHVFARTHGIPHIYYYRRLEHQQWTPWEKLDLDIQSDHLIPVVFERRLRLFWPVFSEKTQRLPVQNSTKRVSAKYWEIQLATSVLSHSGWSAQTVSEEALSFPLDEAMPIIAGPPTAPPTKPPFVTGPYGLEFDGDNITKSSISKRDHRFSAHADGDSIVINCQVFDRLGLSPDYKLPTYLQGQFEVSGCRDDITIRKLGAEATRRPTRTDFDYQKFTEDDTKSDLLYVPTDKSDVPLLERTPGILPTTPGRFQLLPPHQDKQFDSTKPFFFEDVTRTFLVTTEMIWAKKERELLDRKVRAYVFAVFYHPYSCTFIKLINKYGIDGLLNPDPAHPDKEVRDLSRQLVKNAFFIDRYNPTGFVKAPDPHPLDDVDFRSVGAYSHYNWDLFVHVPRFIASQLDDHRKFEAAHRWFHYIFDPTVSDAAPVGPDRYWKIRPFFESNRDVKHTIAWLMEVLEYKDTGPDEKKLDAKKDFVNQIDQWFKNPFNPHLIARMRISAYQKHVVMKYVDHLIAWGDELFRRETIEAINEATQLYVLAASILGKKPREIPERNAEEQSYRELAPRLDYFSNAPGVVIESLLPAPKPAPAIRSKKLVKKKAPKSTAPFAPGTIELIIDVSSTLYFCIPRNDVLLRYWDTVADRLFKIRHCLTIQGVFRQLPLFEPPIDPALLVRATAAGLDLSTILSELNAPLPAHRFTTTIRSALELCSEVQSLGTALLSALEKRDAEALALLRSAHEVALLTVTKEVKQKQLEDSENAVKVLGAAREMADARHAYYSTRELTNEWERSYLVLTAVSGLLQTGAAYLETGAAVAHILPEFTVGVTSAEATTGGMHVGSALDAASRAMSSLSSVTNLAASASATLGSYQRRADEWAFQADLAVKEGEQIDKQIVGAEIRLAIARHDLSNHVLQTKHAKEVDQRMRSKFTNADLYTWMVSQLSQIYFQSYRMTLDLARRAQMCFDYELGRKDGDPTFIEPVYWDSLKKGLLASEKLRLDLRRMETAYLEQSRREYEISKNISLAMLDPLALIDLKQKGQCLVRFEEVLFDSDYPGHYMRRIKSASLSIPCVTGPYTSVNCTLTLIKNTVRITADPATSALKDNFGAIQSITTSTAQNDSGMFELLFRDERYLPFEGAGAISMWQMSLPKDCNAFDFATISDAIFHLKYTAREGGAKLQAAARAAVLNKRKTTAAFRFFSAKLEFPDEWYRFLHPDDTAVKQTLELDVNRDRFPFLYRGMKITVSAVTIFLKLKKESAFTADNLLGFELKIGSVASDTAPLGLDADIGLPKAVVPVTTVILDAKKGESKWTINFNERMIYTPPPLGTPPVAGTPKRVGIEDLPPPPSLKKTIKVGSVEHSRLDTDALEDLWIAVAFKAS